MRMRNLMVGMMAAGLVNSLAGAAMADRLELGVTNKAGVPGRAEIEVDGPSKDGGHTEVVTKVLDYYVSVRGDAPDKAGNGFGAIRLGEGETMVVVGNDWAKYKLSAPYTDPWSGGVVNEYVSPAKLCNQRLNALSGAHRTAFVKKGASFVHQNAYAISGSVSYHIDKKVGFDEIRKYTAAEMVPVNITCLALDRPRVRQDSHTKPAPKPSGQKMKPTISEVGLRIEPASVVQDGNYLCPTKLKLYGTVDTIRKFHGQAVFVGPHYLSNITPLNFQDKGHRNVTGTYPVNWNKKGGLTTSPNAAPAPQKLTFRFNVADKDGKVLESTQETVEVSCKKVKVNAPTASGDVTVN
jgi:hypothetical protein